MKNDGENDTVMSQTCIVEVNLAHSLPNLIVSGEHLSLLPRVRRPCEGISKGLAHVSLFALFDQSRLLVCIV